jgi:hypothetical protein
MEQHLTALTKVADTDCISLHLTAIVAVLLLTMMPFLTGCGGGGGDSGGDPGQSPATGVTASLDWSPVQDPSVYAYFVHYGKQSPGQPGSCAYESSVYSGSPSATVTNLDLNTTYYFTVSAYNGLESPCSSEISTVTPDVAIPDTYNPFPSD